MMSITQKTLLYTSIPTDLYQYSVEKRLRDRFPMSPVTYPAMTVSFLSEGVKKHWNTDAPVERAWNTDTQEWDDYYGSQDAATISISLWSFDEDELRIMSDALLRQLRLNRLGLDWVTDQMKIINIKGVQLLEPYADEFVQEHTWRSVIDIEVEYLWKDLQLAPAIRSFQYLFSAGTITSPHALNIMYSVMEGSYLMDVMITGWRKSYEVDFLLLTRGITSGYSMSMSISE